MAGAANLDRRDLEGAMIEFEKGASVIYGISGSDSHVQPGLYGLLIGNELRKRGYFVEALKEFQKVEKIDQESFKGLLHAEIGFTLSKLGDFRSAVTHFERSIETLATQPGDVAREKEALVLLAIAMELYGRDSEASMEACRKAVTIAETVYEPSAIELAKVYCGAGVILAHTVNGSKESVKFLTSALRILSNEGAEKDEQLTRDLIRTASQHLEQTATEAAKQEDRGGESDEDARCNNKWIDLVRDQLENALLPNEQFVNITM